jgi:hypothetical protein
VLRGTTPAAPDDTGKADPALVAALATGRSDEIGPELLRGRLLVPVLAEPGAGDAEMSVPALVATGGQRALPVFSSTDALLAWQPDARPVPMAGARVFAAAVEEGYAGVVVDVAGPVAYTVTGPTLAALAEAGRALLANPGARVQVIPE